MIKKDLKKLIIGLIILLVIITTLIILKILPWYHCGTALGQDITSGEHIGIRLCTWGFEAPIG